MEILRILEDLEALGESGEKWYTRFPTGFQGKTILDANEFFSALHQLRSSLPEEMTTASQIARDRERIVREAHEERAKILEAAREQAQLLISNDELVRQAEQRAEEILAQARIDAEAVRAEAETWARGVVERLENYVGRISSTIDKTKKALVAQSPPSSGRVYDSRSHIDVDD
ncbi:MAG TPA: ATP synthase F0 subunit B [Armatimonadota bacterium]|jgi:cell division septum initiation protein DivIVA